jgi:hypothetical protein
MANDDLTDIKIALATLEQSNIATAEASRLNTKSHTELNIQITALVGTIKESNVKYDLMIEGSVATANATSAALNTHIEYAAPILLRSKNSQDNIDFMVRGIFSKVGWVLMALLAVGVSVYFGVDPSSIKLN